ncbi:restriction endonuclease subunit S [Tateyamaria sp.]|uniref:restriction endonuclease subunit S n=1 Tax=Tateyamaria sp. TaxID=1929288 RepID=UPI00329FBE73
MSAVSVKLGDVVDFQTGFPFKSKDYSKDGRGLQLLRGDNIGQGFLRWDSAKYWPEPLAKELSQYHLKEGDVVLAMDRPWIEAGLKYSAVSKDDLPSVLVQRVTRFRETEKLSAGYLRYLIGSQGFTEHVHNISTGSVVPHISGGNILEFEFELPSMEIQREIAAILGALDDKIEVNRKTATTLEEMARALYRSWFVDFDPVHAKAAGRAPAHMDTQTAALFPDSFGEDGLPEGWELGTLSDLIDFNPREKLQKGTLAPYLDMKALPTAGMSAGTPYDRAFTSGTKFRARDTLLARITPCLENGKTAMVDDIGDAEIGWGSTEFIVMRAKDGVPPSLPYCVARDASFREDAIASMTGSSGRQRADAKTIAAIEAAVPVEEIVVAFGEATMSMVEKIHQLGRENQTLATLRDTLLPRLMSGELRVGEAKKQVEAVA